MNRRIKILLSVVIVSLSAPVVPLMGHSENIKTEPVAVQAAVKSTGINIENFIEKQPSTINFEIDKAIEEMNQKMVEIESITDKKEWFITYKNIINTCKATISMCEHSHLQALHDTSTELAYNVSEANKFDIPLELLQ